MPEGPHKLVSIKHLSKILGERGFTVEKAYYRFLLPVYIPYVSNFINELIVKAPFIVPLLFYQFIIFNRREYK